MPLLTVFPAAAQVGHGVHAAHLQPHQHRDGEARREADVEAAVAVEVRRIRSVERESLFVRDEHGDPLAVLARVEHLLRLVPGRFEVDGGRLEDTGRAALEVVAEDRGGIEEGREGVEHLVVLALAADRPDRPERGKLQVLQHPPIKREQAQPGGGIVHVVRHERVMDDEHPLEHVLALGNELPPPDRKSTRLNSSHLVISYAVLCLRKSTRLNSSHLVISYAVFCLTKKTTPSPHRPTTSSTPSRQPAPTAARPCSTACPPHSPTAPH